MKRKTRLENIYQYYNYNKLTMTGTLKQISEKINISVMNLREHQQRKTEKHKIVLLEKVYKQYTLYDKDDEIICFGTIKEIAEKTGVSEKTLRFYQTPSRKKRVKKGKTLICVEG